VPRVDTRSPGTRLRELLDGGEIVVAPGCGDAFHARLIAAAGFPAVYISGGWASGSRGFPDLGFLTQTEMLENARYVAQAVEAPVIADADTGFGGLLNISRTIRDFEAAGLAGIQLEDQASPKKCGLLGGKRVVSTEEMATKIEVAVASRRDPDFVIVARSDALAGEGLDATIARGRAYLDAGADMLFVEALRTEEEMQAVGEAFRDRYLLLNRTPRGFTPIVPFPTVHAWGFDLVVLPMHLGLAGAYAAKEMLAELRETGSVDSFEERMLPIPEFFETAGLGAAEALEERYAKAPV
jgi:2-methylisocitrate lyase-like PEP mutase family enzyme